MQFHYSKRSDCEPSAIGQERLPPLKPAGENILKYIRKLVKTVQMANVRHLIPFRVWKLFSLSTVCYGYEVFTFNGLAVIAGHLIVIVDDLNYFATTYNPPVRVGVSTCVVLWYGGWNI